MNRITGKGFAQALDFSLSLVLMLVMLLMFFAACYFYSAEKKESVEEFGLERKRIMLVDSLVKTRSGSAYGLAEFDEKKKRALENRVVFERPGENELFEEAGLESLQVACGKRGKELFYAKRGEKEKEVLRRLVFFGGKKCVLEAVFGCAE